MADRYSDLLGFHFMVFQPNSMKRNVRAWIDGEEYHTYYNYDEMVELAKTVNVYHAPGMRRALADSTFFLWDVDADVLKAIVFREGRVSIKDVIAQERQKERAEILGNSKPISESYFRTEVELDTSS